MARVGIIGCGAMGSLYAKTFQKLGHDLVLSVDPNGEKSLAPFHRLHLGDISNEQLHRLNLMVLAAPTDHHLSELNKLWQRNFSGVVILEKPYTTPDNISELETFLATKGSNLRLFFSDPYSQVPMLKNLSHLWSPSSLRRIEIEFSKNRIADEKIGRTIDQSFGVLGYEYFHMLSILGQVIEPCWNFCLDSVAIDSHNADIRLTEVTHGTRIRLSSSMSGQIFQRDLLNEQIFPSATLGDRRASSLIGEGSEFRYRKASLHFSSGERLYIVFERHFGSKSLDFKNVHSFVIERPDHTSPEVIDFECHFIDVQVANAIKYLNQGQNHEQYERTKFRNSIEAHRWINRFKDSACSAH